VIGYPLDDDGCGKLARDELNVESLGDFTEELE
jgi:hypothetical protein